jgi:hypothetical protein
LGIEPGFETCETRLMGRVAPDPTQEFRFSIRTSSLGTKRLSSDEGHLIASDGL